MASRRRKNRKKLAQRSSTQIKEPLKAAQDIIDCIVNDYSSLSLNIKDINIGLQRSDDNETTEIALDKFVTSQVANIIYLNMKVKSLRNNEESKVILYDTRSGLDRITGSGNTKRQQLWINIRRKYIDKDIIKQSLHKQQNEQKRKLRNPKQKPKMTINQDIDYKQEEKKMNDIDYTINRANNIRISIQAKLKMNLIKLSRDHCAAISSETVSIAKRGYYKIYKSNRDKTTYAQINIDSLQYKSQNNSILYHHDDNYTFCDFNNKKTKYNIFKNMYIEIVNETTLYGCYQFALDQNISNPVALNFASAKNPGGGFLKGSNAQEESLVRNSGLYYTLIKYEKEFYEYHKFHCKSMLYSHSMIYSPNVPIFRDDNGNLLSKYYMCSFITSPAVNCKQFMKRCSGKNNQHKCDADEIVLNTMKYRIDKILDIAVKYNHDAVVLGAFGCGVFGNNASAVAHLFGLLLSTKYKFRFKRIRFSILKRNEKDKIFNEFVQGIKTHFT